jgi:hypothetical protein
MIEVPFLSLWVLLFVIPDKGRESLAAPAANSTLRARIARDTNTARNTFVPAGQGYQAQAISSREVTDGQKPTRTDEPNKKKILFC